MSHPPIFYLFLLLCLLLAAGLTIAALRRANRQRLVLRLAAGWLAVLALWLMVNPPRYTVRGTSNEAVVLTPGYQPDSLRRIVRQLGPATQLWRYGTTTASADTPSLSSVLLLRERYPALRHLHVLGQGLPTTELTNLGPVKLISHQPAAFQGFQQAGWSRRLEAGQPLLVEGVFSAIKPGQPVWISLRGPGQNTDSVQLKARAGSFRLRFLPKSAGLAVYQLRARRGGKLVAAEPVPVEVVAPQPLRVLLLSSTASFEFKFLKNHLGERQHRVALRTGVSRGLTQTEFLNQPAHDLSRVSSSLLARYDVIVADAGTLAALAPAETQALNTTIRTTGLGLIVLGDAAPLPRATPARASFTVVPHAATATDRPQPVRWPQQIGQPTTLIPATIRLAATARPVVADGRQQPVVAAQRLGAGMVMVSVLPQTYPWALQNAASTYAAYWGSLLRIVARPVAPAAQWQVLAAWPRAHEPVALRLVSGTFPTQQPSVSDLRQTAPITLALRQDARLPEWKAGHLWPAAPGWHQVRLANQAPQAFYVFGTTDWQGPERTIREQAAASLQASTSPSTSPTLTSQSYSLLWFFILFVLAAGSLWLEEKL
ncbi:hypothetical protein [Hymenobacter elongatus]|uniref:VWA domain-containing protein n=1 Tax=Hymenobacter elongatus TaxID=877208 RepID=A0A4Z0PQE2_9BACT|nr:hypothetical protein [Hymenobacter elongatus]TGE19735.1 hypothetical protein E5J99_02950 [Hymenobacter elongatus]